MSNLKRDLNKEQKALEELLKLWKIDIGNHKVDWREGKYGASVIEYEKLIADGVMLRQALDELLITKTRNHENKK